MNTHDTLISKVWDEVWNETQWLDTYESNESLRHRVRVYMASLKCIRIFGTFPKDMENTLERALSTMMSKYIISD